MSFRLDQANVPPEVSLDSTLNYKKSCEKKVEV